jgi:hypothetical protein
MSATNHHLSPQPSMGLGQKNWVHLGKKEFLLADGQVGLGRWQKMQHFKNISAV